MVGRIARELKCEISDVLRSNSMQLEHYKHDGDRFWRQAGSEACNVQLQEK